MKRTAWLAWIFVAALIAARSHAVLAAEAPLSREQVDGRALAAEMIGLRPSAGATNEAVLERRTAEGKRSRIPLTIITEAASSPDGTWRTRYTTKATAEAPAEVLEIQHPNGRSPIYVLGSETLSPAQAARPFAGSDFWLDDLALAFLYWPEQRIIPGPRNDPPMVKGRSCKVLESRNPSGGPYSRVVSWVDNEFKTLIQADAYDASGKIVKRFSIGSVKKVNGVWQLKDMEMINDQRDTKTKLEFELNVHE